MAGLITAAQQQQALISPEKFDANAYAKAKGETLFNNQFSAGTPKEYTGYESNAAGEQAFRSAVGNDPNAIYQHYAQYGNKEGIPGFGGVEAAKSQNTVGNVTSSPQQVQSPTYSPRTITPQETVQGQLAGMLEKPNPLMKSAETYALENMQKRGLLSSSLAVNAAQRAMIDSAAPIAAQDASTYAASGLSAQGATQDTSKVGYQGIIQSALQAEQSKQQQALQSQGAIEQQTLASLNNQAKMDLEQFNRQWESNIKSMELAADDRKSFSSMFGPVMQQYQDAFTKIQTDPNTSAEAKSTLINQIRSETETKLTSLGNLFNYRLTWDTPGSGSSSAGASSSAQPADASASPAASAATSSGQPSEYKGFPAAGGGKYKYYDGTLREPWEIDFMLLKEV